MEHTFKKISFWMANKPKRKNQVYFEQIKAFVTLINLYSLTGFQRVIRRRVYLVYVFKMKE